MAGVKLPEIMTEAQFERFAAREDERLELKTGAGRKPLQEALVALSNTAGGVILIGVTDDRVVVGCERRQGIDDAIHDAATDSHDVGRYRIRQIDIAGRPVVAVLVEPRLDAVAQTSDGRVLRRQGGRNRAVFGRDLQELVNSRALVRFEATDSGVGPDAVDPQTSAAVAKAFGWRTGSRLQARWAERGLMHASGQLTIAGALVLTDPGTSLGVSKFCVDVRSYTDDAATAYHRRTAVEGPVQRQVEVATDEVIREIGTETVVTDAYRHDLPRLPRRVVREAIANAVAHRSYEIDSAAIVVEIRPGVVRVTSPGRLPAPVTVENLREMQAARNQSVIDALRRFKLAEDSGQGIDLIQDEMRLELLQEPRFVEDTDRFTVELPLGGIVSPTERGWLAEFERTGRLRADERPLLLAVLREGQITNSRAREILGIDSTEVRARLQRMRDCGLVVQNGTKGRAYYTLGELGPRRTDQQIVLAEAAQGPLTNERVRALTGLDRIAARALLRRLVDEGLLRQEGQRRGTRYHLRGS